tara:strand:+ start:37543 stop:38112 length:570 start_codon:yes stop_codon:yes gene_type:complete
MTENQEEVINIFKDAQALLEGHFILRSGLRSQYYFQCAQVGQYMDKVTRLAELLIQKLPNLEIDTVLAPAMGGLVIGQEVARQLKKRYIFVEKVNDVLELRRGFKIAPGEKVLVVEDVITRGGRAQEAIDIVKNQGGTPISLAVLVDRSQGKATFEVPCTSLVELSFPTYEPDQLPEHLKAIPAIKPGS